MVPLLVGGLTPKATRGSRINSDVTRAFVFSLRQGQTILLATMPWSVAMARRRTCYIVGAFGAEERNCARALRRCRSENRAVRRMEYRIRELERQLGPKTLGVEIPKETHHKSC